MDTTLAPAAFTPATTLGAIVASRPELARFFENLGMDYCCNGKDSLATACAARGLDPDTTLALLASVPASTATATEVNADTMTLSQLADHIETTHHAYCKTELPRLIHLSEHVLEEHGPRDRRLKKVDAEVRRMAGEMLEHMRTEEADVFPLIRRIERENLRLAAALANPIRKMEKEHDATARSLEHLRKWTDDFTPDAQACNTQRTFLASLAAFEQDLHRHVHKENNILFPKALTAAGA